MNHYDSVRYDSDQKDLLVSQLKAQIYELRNSNKDYDSLHRELLNLEHRYSLLQEEKNRQQDDFHSRNDINAKNIANLRSDVDALQAKLSDKNIYIKDLNSELYACRDMLDRRNEELGQLKSELATKADVIMKLRDDLKNMEEDLEILHSTKRANQIEIDRLMGVNDNLSREYDDSTKRVQDLDYELSRANNRIQELNYQLDQRNAQIRENESRILQLQQKGNRDHQSLMRLQGEVKELEIMVERHRKETLDYRGLYDEQMKKNQELMSRLSDAEATVRERDFRLAELRKEIDQQREYNASLLDDKRAFMEELEALKEHCALLEQQNREVRESDSQLNSELEDFVNTSEQVRARLDRKRQVESLKNKNEELLHRSLQSLSPFESSSKLKKSAQF